MKITKHILYAIAFLLLLPFNLLAWLCWFLPMYKRNTFEAVRWDWDGWCIHWDVSNDSKFYRKSMEGWWGFVVGCNIVYVDYFPELALDKTRIKHEKRHVWQNYVLNILFYPAYLLCSAWIWCFRWDLHAYYDNPFEIDARRTAGEQVILSPEDWSKGPNDRWPWW